MTIGEQIREARKKRGLTQKELAKRSGVAAISIHQYEAGKRQPRLEQLLRISSALNVQLFDYTATNEPFAEVNSKYVTKSPSGEYVPLDEDTIPDDLKEILSKRESEHFGEPPTGPMTRILNLFVDVLRENLNEAFTLLNREGQHEAVKRVQELTEIPRYRRQAPPEDTDTTPAAPPPESTEKGG